MGKYVCHYRVNNGILTNPFPSSNPASLFAMSRNTEADGFAFIFSLLNDTSVLTGGGCDTPCSDQKEKHCGCANFYNKYEPSTPRRYAVYDSWESAPQLLRYRNFSSFPDPLLLNGTKLCPTPGALVLST